MNMKRLKAFTLIEMIISVTLFSIIIVFLYQTLDITQKSNKIYKKELWKIEKLQDIKILFFEDILNSTNLNILKDKNKNAILRFNSSNTFHNSFYTNILYIVSKENNLLRIESKIKYSKKTKTEYLQNENRYIDTIQKNVKIFNVYHNEKNKNTYTIYLKLENEKELILSVNTI